MPIDPVCGMAVSALEATAVHEEDGRRFYFCSLACYRAFLQGRRDTEHDTAAHPPGSAPASTPPEPPTPCCCGW